MNKTQFLSVALKFFALTLLITFIGKIASFAALTYQLQHGFPAESIFYAITGSVVVMAIYLVLSIVIWKKSDLVANKVLPQATVDVASKEEILTVVIAYLGLAGTISLLLKLPVPLAQFVALYPEYFEGESVLKIASQLAIFGDLIIDILLLLKAPAISHWLYEKVLARFWK